MGNMAMGFSEMLDVGYDEQLDANQTFDHTLATLPTGLGAGFSIDDIAHPAYMLSFNFELNWCNDKARSDIFEIDSPLSGLKSHNIFDVLAHSSDARRAAPLRLAITFCMRNFSKASLERIQDTLPLTAVTMIKQLAESAMPGAGQAPLEVPFAMQNSAGICEAQHVYGFYFREGVLIIHVPAGVIDPSLLDIISGRESVARNLMRRQIPVLKTLSVLEAELDSFSEVRDSLKPEQYFQLIAETWSRMTPIFRKHFGSYGTHNGDGVRYCFLPRLDSDHTENAAACARELECEMRKISAEWQKRTGFSRELTIKLHIQHRKEWLGPLQSEARLEFDARINQSNFRGRFVEMQVL